MDGGRILRDGREGDLSGRRLSDWLSRAPGR